MGNLHNIENNPGIFTNDDGLIVKENQYLERIDVDDKNGVMAVWHDESHWNRQLKQFPPTLVLDPRYCYPIKDTKGNIL